MGKRPNDSFAATDYSFSSFAMMFTVALISLVLIVVLIEDLSRFGLATVTVRRR